MTDPTAEQHTIRSHAAPSHTRERHRSSTVPLAAFAIGVALTVWIGTIVNGQRQYETNRADNAIVAVEQACAQVERLGGHCVVDPGDVKGDAGPTAIPGPPGGDGQPGRPPTEAEIAAAVAAYLLANPPSAGQPGSQGADGAPGPTCPGGYHLELLTVRLANGGASIQILACVQD